MGEQDAGPGLGVEPPDIVTLPPLVHFPGPPTVPDEAGGKGGQGVGVEGPAFQRFTHPGGPGVLHSNPLVQALVLGVGRKRHCHFRCFNL